MTDISTTVRVYYLDWPLSTREIAEVEELMEWDIEQIRVPFLLPVESEGLTATQDAPFAPLKSAGILRDYGRRTALVQPSTTPVYWCSIVIDAIGRFTGKWPYLIQTESSRSVRGNAGELRVLDMDGAMRDL